MQKHCLTISGREPQMKLNMIRKHTPYMDATNRYIFLIERETTFESKKV